jgi:diguanylate cyclase (GGDEF)-like protein
MTRFIQALLGSYKKNSQYSKECAAINTKRLYYASSFCAVLNFFCIGLFLVTADEHTPQLWLNGVVITHGVLLLFMIGAFFYARKLRESPSRLGNSVLQYMVIVVLFSAGISLAAIDQCITTNITPFLIICLSAAAVLLIRPVYALILYFIAFWCFYLCIGFVGISAEQVLSCRLNALLSACIGYFLSVVMWQFNIANLKQKRFIITQQEQLEKINSELEVLSYYDVLTGLPNRRYIFDLMQKELALNKQTSHETCLIMLDIDNFKQINDFYGHPAGDKLIVMLSSYLLKQIRKYDTLCRLAGDEFLILLPQTNLQESGYIAENLRKSVSDRVFYIDGLPISVTASFGLATLHLNGELSLSHLYADADNALYQAKQSGKNCVVIQESL